MCWYVYFRQRFFVTSSAIHVLILMERIGMTCLTSLIVIGNSVNHNLILTFMTIRTGYIYSLVCFGKCICMTAYAIIVHLLINVKFIMRCFTMAGGTRSIFIGYCLYDFRFSTLMTGITSDRVTSIIGSIFTGMFTGE
jgi:hypothetical protein